LTAEQPFVSLVAAISYKPLALSALATFNPGQNCCAISYQFGCPFIAVAPLPFLRRPSAFSQYVAKSV
jgi:hypothetical protein